MDDRARAKWAKKWGCCVPFSVRGEDSHLTQCGLGRCLPPCQGDNLIHPAVWSQYMGRKVATVNMGRNEGVVPLASWAKACLRTKWHLYASSRLTTIHGPKIGDCGASPFLVRGAGSHLTMSPGPRPAFVPSGIWMKLCHGGRPRPGDFVSG